jgi:glutamate carboxypeptidase
MGLTVVEQRVCESIAGRESALLEQLRRHVDVPTGKHHQTGLDRYRGMLARRLTALGADITYADGQPRREWLTTPATEDAAGHTTRTSRWVPSSLVAHNAGASGAPRVLLVGHLDTVHDPEGAFQSLTVEPNGLTATGPGAADMKGGIVIALAALDTLAQADVAVDWTFLLNSDEESGSFHSEAALRAEAAEHDVGLVVEPALPGGALAIERAGSGQFQVETFGRSAHAGRDFTEGISAVAKLAEVIGRLHALSDPDRGVVVNVGPLSGGVFTNTVPDHAACWGNVRYPDQAEGERLGAAIDAMETPGGDLPWVVVHRAWNRPAKPPTDAVRQLADTAAGVAGDLGWPLPMASTGGVCDGNILQDAGLPTLDTMGVCGGNLHRDDEFVEVESLVLRCQLLAVMLARVGA